MPTTNTSTHWKLLPGPHSSTGPDGETCLAEAAIIAAGFEYRRVDTPYDCPPSFSRLITQYAMSLNDRIPDDLRQSMLMPFITRLADTASPTSVEIERAQFMAIETMRRILPLILSQRSALAEQCQQAQTLEAAREAVIKVIKTTNSYAARVAAVNSYAAVEAARAAYNNDITATSNPFREAAYFAIEATTVVSDAAAFVSDTVIRAVWQKAAAILDEAIALGNQPGPIEIALVASRMAYAKAFAHE
jgi:hypothetical protein